MAYPSVNTLETSPTLRNHALLPWGMLCLALWCAPVWAQASGAKKLIYYGWGIRDTQYIREHWHEMEQMPFDGTGIIVAVDRQGWQQGRQATDNQLGWQVMGKRSFRIEEFHEAIADLKAAKWRTFTDNFLPVVLSSGYAAQLNWFDDDRWRIVVNNFGVVAQIAASGGLKGLILDPEALQLCLVPVCSTSVSRWTGRSSTTSG